MSGTSLQRIGLRLRAEHVVEHPDVTPAVGPLTNRDRHPQGALPMALHQQALARRAWIDALIGIRSIRVDARIDGCVARDILGSRHVAPFDDLELGPALSAVDRHPVALPGCVGV